MFDEYYDTIKQREKPEMTTVKIYDSPVINSSLLIEKLISMDSMTDSELFNMIRESFDNLLKQIFTGKNTYDYLFRIINTRFLTILTQVVSTIEITHIQKIYCNKLAYDYLTLKDNDEYTKQVFFNLSRAVNRKCIELLSSIGLHTDLAAYIALARNSSEKEIVNTKRVNFILITSPAEIMTEQMIVRIYEILFDSITPLFEGIMFDALDTNEEGEYDDEKELIFSRIGLVILDILNGMTLPQIRQILISYEGDRSMCKQKSRFEVSAVSTDYARILQVVEELKTEGVYVY